MRLLIAAGLCVHALPAPAAVVPGVGRALRIGMALTMKEGVALTFDDGPHPEGTPATLHPGDVILLHDADHYSAPGSWRRTVAALPRILDALARGGQPVVAVG